MFFRQLLVGLIVVAVLSSGVMLAQDRPRRERQHRLGPAAEWSQEQVDRFMEVIAATRPKLADRLADLREADSQRFDESLDRLAQSGRFRRLLRLGRNDAEALQQRLREMRIQIRIKELSRRLRSGSGDAEAIRVELKQAVTESFDERLKSRERELQRLEERLTELRQRLGEDRTNREQIIEQHFQRIVAAPARSTSATVSD